VSRLQNHRIVHPLNCSTRHRSGFCFSPVCPFVWFSLQNRRFSNYISRSTLFSLGRKQILPSVFLGSSVSFLICHLVKKKIIFEIHVDRFRLFECPLTVIRLQITILNRSSQNFTNRWGGGPTECNLFLRSKWQKDITVQKFNNYLISKTLNFHPIYFKFE